MDPVTDFTRSAERKQPAKLSVMKKPVRRKGPARRTSAKKNIRSLVAIRKPHVIYQEDLTEFLILKKRACETLERFEEKERCLCAMAQAGAKVEPGLYTAKIKSILEVE